MATDAFEPEQVLLLLDRVRKQWFASRVLSGLLAFTAIILTLAFLFVGTEILLAPPAGARWAMLILLLALTLAAAIALIGKRLLENPSDEQVALLIETARPQLHNELINAIRFTEESWAERLDFVRAAIRESDRCARRLDTRGIVAWTGARRGLAAAGVLLLVWAGMLCITPKRIANAFSRVLMPAANIEKVGSVRIVSVTPGDMTIIAGDNLTISAALDGAVNPDAPPRLEHFPDKGAVQKEAMVAAEENRYACELQQIKTPRTYRVVVGDSRSRDFRIRITERPLVTRIAARLQHPDYTGLPPETIADTGGRIMALRGAKASLTFFTNKRLKTARLTLADTEPLTLAIAAEGTAASTLRPLAIMQEVNGTVEIVDQFNCINSRSLQIIARKDQPPQVKIVAPGKDATLAVGEALHLSIRATDDYGVVHAELVEKRVNPAAGRSGQPTVLHSWTKFTDNKTVGLNWKWEFSPESYKNGEIVRYFARMVDGNTVDGPGIGTSAEFTVRLEDAQARRKDREKKFSNWQAELEQVLKRQKALRHMSGDMLPKDAPHNPEK